MTDCQCCDGSGCGCCDNGGCEFQPLSIPELLDAARNGTEFAAVLGGLFTVLEKARDEEAGDE